MPSVKLSAFVPVPPQAAWETVSDLSRLGEWLSMHEGWRGELPATLTVGAQLTGVVRVKGMRNRVTWTVRELDPPSVMQLTGDGVGGTSVALSMQVRADGAGSRFELVTEFKHPALRGPLGKVAEKAVTKDLEASVQRFVELAG